MSKVANYGLIILTHVIWKRNFIKEVDRLLDVHKEDCGLPLLEKDLILEQVVKFASLRLTKKDVDPTMDWVDYTSQRWKHEAIILHALVKN